MKLLVLTIGLALALEAEVHTLTLKQVTERALTQSPDALLARLDEQRAEYDAAAARDPYYPKFHVGSGLGKAFGFPMLGGSAPSVFEARGSAPSTTVSWRSNSSRLAKPRAVRRSVGHGGASRRCSAPSRRIWMPQSAKRVWRRWRGARSRARGSRTRSSRAADRGTRVGRGGQAVGSRVRRRGGAACGVDGG